MSNTTKKPEIPDLIKIAQQTMSGNRQTAESMEMLLQAAKATQGTVPQLQK